MNKQKKKNPSNLFLLWVQVQYKLEDPGKKRDGFCFVLFCFRDGNGEDE